MRNDFGIFEPVFASAHGYLALLHLGGTDAAEYVRTVKRCCDSVATPYGDIIKLLENPNWRPHLVAAIALATKGYHELSFEALWSAFDSGSWVSPQLAVVASLHDSNFSNRARSRLSSLCRVDETRGRGMSMLERHSATGPGSGLDRAAKAAATLNFLLQPDYTPSAELQSLIERDVDDSSAITQRWRGKLNEILELLK